MEEMDEPLVPYNIGRVRIWILPEILEWQGHRSEIELLMLLLTKLIISLESGATESIARRGSTPSLDTNR